MKQLFKYLLLSFVILLWQGCEKDELPGSIYGVVVENSKTEPLAGLGVELYLIYDDDHKALLLKTVTYSDGHFEFVDLTPGEYFIKVVAAGYDESTTEYYVKVESARQARVDMQVNRLDTHLTVVTMDPIVSGRTITLQLEYTRYGLYTYDPTELGFIYATHNNPISSGVTVKMNDGESLVKLNDLESNTYYVVAYAVNKVGVTYGEIKSFVISDEPIVTTLEVSNITFTNASFSAIIDYIGSSKILGRGFVYSSTFSQPTIDDSPSATTKKVVYATSTEFSTNVNDLVKDKRYYVRAYLTTDMGTYYGETKSFRATPIQSIFIYGAAEYQVSPYQGSLNWDDAISNCTLLNYEGYSDWYLPGSGELEAMCENKNNLGISDAIYWSSEEYIASNVWALRFGNSYWDYYNKTNKFSVLCVRRM